MEVIFAVDRRGSKVAHCGNASYFVAGSKGDWFIGVLAIGDKVGGDGFTASCGSIEEAKQIIKTHSMKRLEA